MTLMYQPFTDNDQVLISCWLFDATTLEFNITKHYQDIMLKQFQQQLTVPPNRQTLLSNMKEKLFLKFLSET